MKSTPVQARRLRAIQTIGADVLKVRRWVSFHPTISDCMALWDTGTYGCHIAVVMPFPFPGLEFDQKMLWMMRYAVGWRTLGEGGENAS